MGHRPGGKLVGNSNLLDERAGILFVFVAEDVHQHVVDRLDGALKSEANPDFLKREIGLFGEKKAHLLTMAAEDQGLATAAVMERCDTAGVAALLDEFLDHSQRNVKAPGHLLSGDIPAVIGLQDAFAQIHGIVAMRNDTTAVQTATQVFKLL